MLIRDWLQIKVYQLHVQRVWYFGRRIRLWSATAPWHEGLGNTPIAGVLYESQVDPFECRCKVPGDWRRVWRKSGSLRGSASAISFMFANFFFPAQTQLSQISFGDPTLC